MYRKRERERERDRKRNYLIMRVNILADVMKFLKLWLLKRIVDSRVGKNASSALESVQEKDVVSRNDKNANLARVPSPFASKSNLSVYFRNIFQGIHPPPNCNKRGFSRFLDFNISSCLRLLSLNAKRLDLWKINKCDNHNNDNDDVGLCSDEVIIMSIDSDKDKTAMMAI